MTFTSRPAFSSKIAFTSKSGMSSQIPGSWQAYYPFLSDFQDDVSNDYLALFDNLPTFGGGGVNTVANTNLRVTTFQADGKGVYLDDGDGGVDCKLSNFTNAGFVDGVDQTSMQMTFVTSGDTGKYQGLVVTPWVGMVGYAKNGSIIRCISIVNDRTFNFEILKGVIGDVTDTVNGFAYPAVWIPDFSFSDFYPNETGVGSVAEMRTNAGDDVSGVPAAKPWDTSGDFRFGYIGVGKTVADITAQVMLQTGNMGISTGIGITFAEIGASISSLPVTSDAIVGECFLKYVGGMLSIVIDGAESTPVASAAPAIGAFAQIGANISNASPAPGTYGGLLFEPL